MISKASRGSHATLTKPVATAAPMKRRSSRPKDDSGYPKFFRQGDQLIRVAWSKREKGEYQHKATYSVVQAVALAIAGCGKNGRVFST